MALEGIGFALGVIPEVRHQVTRAQERFSNFAEGPTAFQDLMNQLDGMTSDKETIEKIVRQRPVVVPEVTSPMFCSRLEAVKQCLERSKAQLDELSNDAFPESNSKKRKKVEAMFRRIFRADSILNKMETVANQVMRAATLLEGLVTRLTTCVKMEDINLNRADDHKEPSYVSEGNTPILAPTVTLDYYSKDAEGDMETPEGKLKHCVLTSDSSTDVTAAVGVVGMAGVGKTVALQGLAHDKEIQARFPDGVHYMSLGHSATLHDVVSQVAKIMRTTGATVIVDKIESCSSLCDAVDYANTWFRGKTCLFLIDDLWPTHNRKTGYLNDLLQLLRGSPKSRIAITTRSVEIACLAGLKVDFGARNPLGHVSLRLFMKYATGSLPADGSAGHVRGSVSKILSACGGLPIALAVTGCAVKFLLDDLGNFNNACDTYVAELQMTKMSLVEIESPGGTSLNVGILLSLKYLDDEFVKWKAVNDLEMEQTVTDLYTGLCVLQNQTWAPLSVLCRLWNVEVDCAFHVLNRICALSLATRQYRDFNHGSTAEPGLLLHDLHLEFCKRRAERTMTQSTWHAQLLNGYLSTSPYAFGMPLSTKRNAIEKRELLKLTPREWWSVPQDGYIHSNISWHLSFAARELELAALLLDARWTTLRGSIGGILGLKTDFEQLEKCFMQLNSSEDYEAVSDLGKSFKRIFKAVRISWGRYIEGLRSFQFQICAHLQSVRQSDNIVDSFLKSVEGNTPKPYLLPVSSLNPDASTAQIMEIPVRGECHGVACSPCEQYIAAGNGSDVAVADCSTGEILRNIPGDNAHVTCLAFLAGSKKIVCGYGDGKIMVWTWELLSTPTQVLEGHRGKITGIAVSADGQRIISTSQDRTVRSWDTNAGTQTWELLLRSFPVCVALCSEHENIALGFEEGTLKVLDGSTKETILEATKVHEDGVTCISFSPNGSHLATGSSDTTVRLWNTQTWTGKCLEGTFSDVKSVSFSPDCENLASSYSDGTIRLWDVGSGTCAGVSPSIGSPIESVSFTPDGEKIASGSELGIVHIWDARLGNASKEQTYGHTGPVRGVAISKDGLRVASASEDGTICVWDSLTGEQVGVPLEGHELPLDCVSLSSDGRRCVSGSRDYTLRLWDTDTCTQIGNPFEGHTGQVWCVAFSSDDRRIISGSCDTSIRIWNVETQEQIGDALQGHSSYVACVSDSADGCHIVSRDVFDKLIIGIIATEL